MLHCMVINTNLYLLYLYIYYQSLAVDPQQQKVEEGWDGKGFKTRPVCSSIAIDARAERGIINCLWIFRKYFWANHFNHNSVLSILM